MTEQNDTPRTDALYAQHYDPDTTRDPYGEMGHLAEQLERELTAANQRIRELEQYVQVLEEDFRALEKENGIFGAGA